MLKIIVYIVSFFTILFLLISCENKPTLQKYLVENSEKKDFIAVDVSPSILNLETQKLTSEEKRTLSTIKNMNIIAFESNNNNQKQYQEEKNKIANILKDKKYQELIKVGSGSDGASVSFVGEDDKIDEFVLYGNKKENGLALVRIVGNDMNPADLITMISLLKKSNVDMKQFQALEILAK